MITVLIDELTPCLLDAKTNELVETEVVQITRKSFLQIDRLKGHKNLSSIAI